MDKIVISGYYGFNNLGDEAILAGIIHSFRSFGKKLEITVLSNQPEVTAARYRVRAIYRNDIKEIIRTISNCDLFISGGGSLLQDITGWRSIPYYLGLVFLAQLLGKKTVFYAQGVGPVKSSSLNKKLIKWIGNRTELITVRDFNSQSLLTEIGIRPELIKKTVDPVFGLESECQLSVRSEFETYNDIMDKSKLNVESLLIGVAVRPWKNNDYLEALACSIDFIVKKFESKILIIPMHWEQDQEISKDLKEMLDSGRENYRVQIWKKVCGPVEMLNIFSQLDFLIGVRLHSLIFAAVNRVPFVGISYDPKVDSFLQSLGIEAGIEIEKCSFRILKNRIENIWSIREQFIKKLEIEMNSRVKEARLNARRVLDLL